MAEKSEGEMSFAEKMMRSMGWSDGKGLGKEESGMKDFIKPKMKFNTKGIGFMGVDNKWIAHQEHFDDLLTSLNKGEIPDQKKDIACLTSETKLRGRTKFYAKMMRGKDLSNRSSQDLGAIILPLNKKDEKIEDEKPESAPLPSELDGTLTASQVSMDDYFAKMMAQRKAKLGKSEDKEGTESDGETKSRREKKLEKKARKSALIGKEVEEENKEEEMQEEEKEKKDTETNEKKKKKRSKEKKKEKPAEQEEEELRVDNESETDDKTLKKKKKKKNKKPDMESTIAINEDVEEEKKVKNKRKRKSPESDTAAIDETEVSEEKKSKKKKKKSQQSVAGQSENEDEVTCDQTIEETKNGSKKTKKQRKEFDLNSTIIDTELLKEIRGKSLRKSKAAPIRELTDEQIKEIYRLWSTGAYGEFMNRVHSGEFPRWVALEKAQVDKMISGRKKLIDLGDVRDVLEQKWPTSNAHEIWGYTNVPYLAI